MKGREVILFVLVQDECDHRSDDRDIADYCNGFSFRNSLIVHGISFLDHQLISSEYSQGLTFETFSQKSRIVRFASYHLLLDIQRESHSGRGWRDRQAAGVSCVWQCRTFVLRSERGSAAMP